MSFLNDFLSFYIQLLIPSIMVYVALIHSFSLRVSKKKAYLVGFLCANILPLSDTLAILIVGKQLIPFTAEVYWGLKTLNYLTSFIVLIFFFLVISKEWFYCYWWFLILQIGMLIPVVCTYDRRFIFYKEDIAYFRKLDMSSLPEYVAYLLLSFAVGCFFTFISKKVIKRLSLNKVSKWIWYSIYIVWVITLFLSDKEYVTNENKALMDSITNIDKVMDFLVVMFIIIFVTINIYDKKVLKVENSLLKQKNELQYENYISVQKQEEEIHKLYHDIGNHIDTIKVLLNNGNTKEAKKYSDTLSIKYADIRNDYYCENKIINAVLMQKFRLCKQDNIRYEFELQLSKDCVIREIDIMSIFSNLLDNAIEGCKRTELEDKYILLNVMNVGDYFVVNVRNSYDKQIHSGNEVSRTTWKKNKKYHGYGIKIMNEIVERYEGKSSFKQKDNIFEAMVMLKMK